MATYETGLTTKNSILAACRQLFYEKGFDATTYTDIANQAQVNQGSIHYHFGGKNNILDIFYWEMIRKDKLITDALSTPETLHYTKFLFGGMVYMYKMWKDEKIRRLYLDMDRLMTIDNFGGYLGALASSIYEDGGDKYLTGEQRYKLIALLGFDAMVRIDFARQIKDLDYRQVSRQCADIYLQLLDVDDETAACVRRQIDEMDAVCPWERIDTTLDPERIYID